MSHEIRTPINGVVGATEILLDGDLKPEQRDLLNIILGSAKSLGNIINDVLDLSKLEQSKVVIESIPVNIKEIVNDLFSLMSIEAKRKNILLTSQIKNQDMPLYIGDPTRIRQVLANILGNAIKFTSEGGVSIDVDFAPANSTRHKVNFHIKDSGIGIAEDKIASIFDTFSQAEDCTTRQFGGSGLGMSISRELAQLMGGDISVESTLGDGSNFTFSLFLERAAENQYSDKEASHSLSRNYGKKVLLAEDVEVNALLAKKMLSSLGLEVDVVENGKRAVDEFDSSYDLVLMDMQMPVMDGIEASRQLISKGCNVPIVAFTANASADDVRLCSDAGMKGHLAKPLYKKEIIQELDRHIGH